MSKICEIAAAKQKKPEKRGLKGSRPLFMGLPLNSLFTGHNCLLIKIYS
jgi:hypothetical protein